MSTTVKSEMKLHRTHAEGLALLAPRRGKYAFLRDLCRAVQTSDLAVSKNFLTPRRRDAVTRVGSTLPPVSGSHRHQDPHLR
ncbi:MAG TPA: hypothetical protein VKN76_17255 [Kiloniellaceae bacterium]|nr:hypothetical protein [Kiloniellaceae bacterium]